MLAWAQLIHNDLYVPVSYPVAFYSTSQMSLYTVCLAPNNFSNQLCSDPEWARRDSFWDAIRRICGLAGMSAEVASKLDGSLSKTLWTFGQKPSGVSTSVAILRLLSQPDEDEVQRP